MEPSSIHPSLVSLSDSHMCIYVVLTYVIAEGCPFVTGVGATQIDPNKTVNDPEGAANQVIFSGGVRFTESSNHAIVLFVIPGL